MFQAFAQRLYLRIWLAVVGGGAGVAARPSGPPAGPVVY